MEMSSGGQAGSVDRDWCLANSSNCRQVFTESTARGRVEIPTSIAGLVYRTLTCFCGGGRRGPDVAGYMHSEHSSHRSPAVIRTESCPCFHFVQPRDAPHDRLRTRVSPGTMCISLRLVSRQLFELVLAQFPPSQLGCIAFGAPRRIRNSLVFTCSHWCVQVASRWCQRHTRLVTLHSSSPGMRK